MASLTQTLSEYRDDISLSKSPATVDSYCRDLQAFFDWLIESKVSNVKAIKGKHVNRYLQERKAGGAHDTSLTRYYMSLSHFAKWARKHKLCEANFCEDVDRPRSGDYIPFVPNTEQVKQLLSEPNSATECGCRDLAILELLYSSGLRASEVCDLELADLRASSVRVVAGKGNKSRIVPVTAQAMQAIERYVNGWRGRDEGYLFVTNTHKKRLDPRLLCRNIAMYGRKAGMQDVTTHTLRHACATHLLEHGADIRMIQMILGHSSITSTERYTHISSAKLDDMFKKFHPREQKNG